VLRTTFYAPCNRIATDERKVYYVQYEYSSVVIFSVGNFTRSNVVVRNAKILSAYDLHRWAAWAHNRTCNLHCYSLFV
jgi:hypothetical protein